MQMQSPAVFGAELERGGGKTGRVEWWAGRKDEDWMKVKCAGGELAWQVKCGGAKHLDWAALQVKN